MKTARNKLRKKHSPTKLEKTYSNAKRSRFLRKTDEDILLEILIRVERAGSFCPEKLMRTGRNRIFEEAYHRFDSWDMIVEQCISLSHELALFGTILKNPKELVLEILRMETGGRSLQESDVVADYPELHASAILFYGSWHRILAIAGIKSLDQNDDLRK